MAVKTTNVNGIGSVTIVRKRGVRSMHLNVDSQGKVRLTLPWWVSAHTGLSFVLSKTEWINGQKNTVKFVPHDQMAFGKGLMLHLETAKLVRPSKKFDGKNLIVRIPESLDIAGEAADIFIVKSITWALRIQAEELLLPRIRELASQHGYHYKSCSVKQLKARWGSCNQYTDIVLNLYLIQLSYDVIDYVLLHELNHTKHMYHGPVFWNALESACPDAKKLRKKLHAYQPRLYDAQKTANGV